MSIHSFRAPSPGFIDPHAVKAEAWHRAKIACQGVAVITGMVSTLGYAVLIKDLNILATSFNEAVENSIPDYMKFAVIFPVISGAAYKLSQYCSRWQQYHSRLVIKF